jgi:hypothetical protein
MRYPVSDQLDEPWRRHPSFLRAAAWIPEADQNLQRWEELETVAVAWVEEQAALDDVTSVVFYNAAKAYGGHGPVQALASRHGYSFPLERGGRRGAVLAVRPDARSLHRAAGLARGSALVVLESHLTPLIGWAARTAARDLSGVHPDVPALHPDAKAALDRALFFTGRNNWTGLHEREHARGVLEPVVRGGLIEVDTAVGYALAHNAVSELGAKNLRTIMERLQR